MPVRAPRRPRAAPTRRCAFVAIVFSNLEEEGPATRTAVFSRRRCVSCSRRDWRRLLAGAHRLEPLAAFSFSRRPPRAPPHRAAAPAARTPPAPSSRSLSCALCAAAASPTNAEWPKVSPPGRVVLVALRNFLALRASSIDDASELLYSERHPPMGKGSRPWSSPQRDCLLHQRVRLGEALPALPWW